MDYSLHHIVRQPKTPTANPNLLLMLHGYGSHEEDLFSLAPALPDDLLIISARAPMPLAFGGYAWYSIHFEAENAKYSDIPEAKQAVALLQKFIDELQATYHFNPEHSFIMGFSQGSILSYAFAFNYPKRIYNYIATSGYILEDLLPENPDAADYAHLSFFCSHGTQDPVIPVAMARKSRAFLEKHKISYLYKEYNTGHGLTPENIDDILEFIRKKLRQ